MFRIRTVPDDSTPGNAEALRQVQAIWRARFPLVAEEDIVSLPAMLRGSRSCRFRSLLLVGEDARHQVQGFALLLHARDLPFCYLDPIAIVLEPRGRGIGGALYERVREEASALGSAGVFLECPPDDPALSPDPVLRAENAERLKFYERYGARPIAGTRYETPLTPGDTDPPYLVLDPLGHETLPRLDQARAIVGAILERKYGKLCPPAHRRMVVESFRDDPIRLRARRYVWRPSREALPLARWREDPRADDVDAVRALIAAAGVFSSEEATIAAELIEERLAGGTDSGYWLIFAELGERLAGYSCYGPIPGTEGRFDLYWIAVHPEHRRSGIGRELLRRTEAGVAALGGRRLYIDTSANAPYEAARRFYQASGYRKVAELPDFFRDGDGKVIYTKALDFLTDPDLDK